MNRPYRPLEEVIKCRFTQRDRCPNSSCCFPATENSPTAGHGDARRTYGDGHDGDAQTALRILRDLARLLTEHRGKDDWALVDVHDIAAFPAVLPNARKRRLVVLRQFFSNRIGSPG
ncbi:hypothetical protein ACFYZJ_17925 [Streptomyces sp. NPDC001848]|uniref:hypothetical protein n=1 Tax=Streptomyces sp. NPDC001848 TaxID=3364618 RepID=UPI0036C0B0A7